ncbi:MAG TPA: hypothetical protein V6D12_05285 [Candidatus Obscuribacterales bacterium]
MLHQNVPLWSVEIERLSASGELGRRTRSPFPPNSAVPPVLTTVRSHPTLQKKRSPYS